MNEKITLDRETFRALAVDTRIEMLKRLGEEHQLTLTDLSQGMEMAPSTIKEHLERLVEVDLIRQVDGDTKWKYYRLTDKGRQLLNPYEKRVWIVLSTTILLLFASLYRLIYQLENALTRTVDLEGKYHAAPGLDSLGEGNLMKAASNVTGNISSRGAEMTREAAGDVSTVTSTLPGVVHKVVVLPYAELALTLLLAVVAGLCTGYLIRRKRII
ncbi:MAG: winged helix-turn-helix domain-containing protein [Candidatus Altiarchaeota archaeon]|nr:winged helix-turn-helix domain-containing protein [Candidatus Altiarchaeota archaeon]